MGKLISFVFKTAIWFLGLGLVFVGVMRFFFVDAAVVGHNAMAPTMFAGDEVLLWRDADVELGDVVICDNPTMPGQLVTGRVIGVPGMVVEAHRGQLRLDGNVPQYDIYSSDLQFFDWIEDRVHRMVYGIEKFGNTEHLFFRRKDQQLMLRPHSVQDGVYLLSDNRSTVGQDSRAFGEVDPDDCRGVVFMRLFPADAHGNELEEHAALDIIH